MIDFWAQFFGNAHRFMPHLLTGAVVTIQVTVAGFLLAALLGAVVVMVRLSRFPVLRRLAIVYIDAFRGVPAITQLFLLYFGLGQLGFLIDSFTAGVIGLGVIYSAYLAEVYRASLQAVHRGQFDAGLAIGMTPWKVLRYVVIPQAAVVVIPPAVNQLLSLLKESSIIAAIGLPELLFTGRAQARLTFLPLQVYLGVALVYLALSVPLTRLGDRLERRLHRRFAAARG